MKDFTLDEDLISKIDMVDAVNIWFWIKKIVYLSEKIVVFTRVSSVWVISNLIVNRLFGLSGFCRIETIFCVVYVFLC